MESCNSCDCRCIVVAGRELVPPCGSVLTFNTVVKCKSILTKVPKERKRKKSTKPELNKNAYLDSNGANTIITQNENFIAWPALDVDDVYDKEEIDDTNLSEIAGYKEPFDSTRSIQDLQGKTTTPAKYFLSNAMRRWKQRRVNPKFPPTSKRSVPRPIPPPSVEANTGSGLTAHRPIPEQMNKISSNITAASQNITFNCVLGGFLGTVLAWLALLLGAVLTWLLFTLIRTTYDKWNKNPKAIIGWLAQSNQNAEKLKGWLENESENAKRGVILPTSMEATSSA
ncbi:hypothetical protein OS493_029265 [Desmophyllum pertusum]|uniref:Uncharacterized protein n=1 Tax=Desmophyllum pertusum TaxID=174260 RepID=A0A9W9ZKV7_9CNID|nr:hypothetical protein OS493_029265 [Desmophyllum pertusum]